jgi:hypothetical protein
MKAGVALSFLLLSLIAFSQDGSGTIGGTITGPEGEHVPYIWIRAKADGTEAGRTETALDGAFVLNGLSPGSYVLETNPPCCAYMAFESEEVLVEPGETTMLEIQLEEGDSFNTVGDDPGVIASAIRSQSIIPDQPPPRLPGGRPDLSGVWMLGSDPFPEEVEAHPWAQALWDERVANYAIDHPHNDCLPAGPPIAGAVAPFMTKFVHKEELLVILMEDYPGFRQVYVDGRVHPEYSDPSWMGDSVGKWDGDTLVVDTNSFNDRGWVDLWPRSEELHITEKYTRPEFGRIDLEITFEDPKVYIKPWKKRISLYLAPDEDVIEYVCENNKW